MRDDVHYFAARAQEERAAAMRCVHLKARAAHLEMARLYQARVDAMMRSSSLIGGQFAGAA